MQPPFFTTVRISSMTNLLTVAGPDGTICTLKENGKVIWEDGYTVDEAADMFAEALTIGTRYHAGINKQYRKETITSIYSELIDLVDRRGGSITKEDLTTELEQRIIVDKLQDI